MFPKALSLAVFTATSIQVQAATTILHHFRLGDDDPGASSGALFASTTEDSAGEAALVRRGKILYSSDVPFPALGGVTNSFSAQFRGESPEELFTDARLLDLTDNFGIELFAKVYSAKDGLFCLVNDGKSGTTGFGIFQSGDEFAARSSTSTSPWVATISSGTPFTLNEWYHLALVRDQGVSTFYVDGFAVGSTTDAPVAGSITFRIGSSVGNDTMNGLIDEVRLFTFESGAFNTKDLLIHQVPEPSAAGLLAIGLTALLTRQRRAID